ncbi:hypothetical protein GQ457_13G009710 [Hibiscus cannabinus]
MPGYPYYSPPPPPPPPPNCTTPPPPPPPKCNPCPCVCICEFTPPPTTPPPPPPPPVAYPPWAPAPVPTTPPVPPGPDHTVIIAVFVSLGGAFFLAFLAVGLFCLAKRKKNVIIIPPPVEETACVEEHRHIQETITTSPCGEETVTVTVDDDVRIHEAVGSYVEPPSDGHLKTG